jgi:hypothetical protein
MHPAVTLAVSRGSECRSSASTFSIIVSATQGWLFVLSSTVTFESSGWAQMAPGLPAGVRPIADR